MGTEKLEFNARKTKIIINYSNCEPAINGDPNPSCGFACVKACRLYGRNILKIEGNKPVLSVTDPEEIKRIDNECLSCEYNCWLHGNNCITNEVQMPGFEECRAKLRGGSHGNNY